MSVNDFLFDLCWMSLLLLVSKVVRVKLKVLQSLYIPSALIAGFLGLLLGHQGLGWIPFSGAISSYSGILICVLFGSMFLGGNEKVSFKKMMGSVGDTFLVNGASEICQFGLFIFLGVTVLPLFFKNIHPAFGLMLPSGFVGGHGTAAAIGGVLAENGWDEAASIGQTFATIGLLGGIIGGVALINIAVRKNYTPQVKETSALPLDMQSGLIAEKDRVPFGSSTISAMSMDTLSWHFLLIMTAVGAGYAVAKGMKVLLPSISFPTYGLALLCSIALQQVLRLFKLDKYVDKKIVTHIGSSSTDYLVAFGVASINLTVVVKYAIPILITALLGFCFVIAWLWIVSPRFFRKNWFERGIYIYGMSTGVLATGVILLRIVDPEFKTGVLEDFGFAWIFLSIVDMLLVSVAPMLVISGIGSVAGLALIALAAVMLVVCKVLFKVKPSDNQ